MEEHFQNKNQLLEAIQNERRMLEATLAGVDPETFEAPRLDSGWSVKDALAHITAWEQDMLRWLADSLAGNTPDRPAFGLSTEIIDEINADFYKANLEKTSQQVLDEANRSYQAVLDILRQVSEAALFGQHQFDWLEGQAFWPIVAANTCWHYNEHRIDIQTLLSSS